MHTVAYHRASLGLLAVMVFVRAAAAIRFEIGAREQKCFTEDLPPGTNVSVKYTVAHGPSATQVTFGVSHGSHAIFTDGPAADAGVHSFTTARSVEDEEYRFCFTSHPTRAELAATSRNARRKVFLEVTSGSRTRDYSALAKDRHLDAVDIAFRQVNDRLAAVIAEIDRTRRREDQMHQRAQSTAVRLVAGAIATSVAVLGAAVAQSAFLHRELRRAGAIKPQHR